MVADTIGTFISLTVHCARCHNHKFDPITQEDYYSLQAVFAARRPRRPALRRRRGNRAATRGTRSRGASSMHSASGRAGRQRTSDAAVGRVRCRLQELPSPRLVYAGTVHARRRQVRRHRPSGGRPRQIHVLERGDVTQPGKLSVPARAARSRTFRLASICRRTMPKATAERRSPAGSTDANNPLTWRSIVNRVWQYHFGRGIVDSPNDFGRMGRLADASGAARLAGGRVPRRRQSLKQLHRLIVTSAAYRQASSIATAAQRRNSSTAAIATSGG